MPDMPAGYLGLPRHAFDTCPTKIKRSAEPTIKKNRLLGVVTVWVVSHAPDAIANLFCGRVTSRTYFQLLCNAKNLHVRDGGSYPLARYAPLTRSSLPSDPVQLDTRSVSFGIPGRDSKRAETLDEVVETCRSLGVAATLKDEPGFTKGHVDADGAYRLV